MKKKCKKEKRKENEKNENLWKASLKILLIFFCNTKLDYEQKLFIIGLNFLNNKKKKKIFFHKIYANLTLKVWTNKKIRKKR